MTKEIQNPNGEPASSAVFVIRISVFPRISAFVIRIWELWFMQSPLRFCACIGTMNPPPAPPRRGATPAGRFPSREGSGVGRFAPGSWKGAAVFTGQAFHFSDFASRPFRRATVRRVRRGAKGANPVLNGRMTEDSTKIVILQFESLTAGRKSCDAPRMGDLNEFSVPVKLFLKAYPWRKLEPVPWTPLKKPLDQCRL